ncbi:MAG: hypothetical protein AAGH17_05695 [Pseudomonadota bacterium]
MASDLTWMLAMNNQARAFGDGLKPELEALLLRQVRPAAEGTVPLNTQEVSAGPGHQFASPERLKADGIASLQDFRAQRQTDRRAKAQG